MKKATEEEAYEVLERLNIPYKRIDHEPINSVIDCDVDLPGPQVKNLLVKAKKNKKYYYIIVPDEKKVDLKRLAEQIESTRLSFASGDELNELTGLQPGTLTPLGLHYDDLHKIQVIVDRSIDRQDTIGLHPNVNTTTLIISFTNMERLLKWSKHDPLYVSLEDSTL